MYSTEHVITIEPASNPNHINIPIVNRILAEKETNEIDFSITKRLVFKFGETEQDVKDKLYERDIVLEFEKKVGTKAFQLG